MCNGFCPIFVCWVELQYCKRIANDHAYPRTHTHTHTHETELPILQYSTMVTYNCLFTSNCIWLFNAIYTYSNGLFHNKCNVSIPMFSLKSNFLVNRLNVGRCWFSVFCSLSRSILQRFISDQILGFIEKTADRKKQRLQTVCCKFFMKYSHAHWHGIVAIAVNHLGTCPFGIQCIIKCHPNWFED